MIHNMKLRPTPFAQIRSGSKTIELRLYDEKRRQIQVGDTIVFSNTVDLRLQLSTRVIALHRFPTFADLFASIPADMCGFETKDQEAVEEMQQYYSAAEEAKYGVVGIEMQLMEAHYQDPSANDPDRMIGEGISNEEYLQRFLNKYTLYGEGKLTRSDFLDFENFLLMDLLKEEAERQLEALNELLILSHRKPFEGTPDDDQ